MMCRATAVRTAQAVHITSCGCIWVIFRIAGPDPCAWPRAGRDAARAFATGCFATHQTHDIRGLSSSELQVRVAMALETLFACRTQRVMSGQSLEHWKKYFANSKKYRKVGRVLHEPIDPMSPIPEHCDPKKAAAAPENASKPADKHHDEL